MTEGRFVYFLGGLGIGLAVALLCAPRSGEVTRTVLKERASAGTDYLRRQGSEIRSTVGDAIERGTRAAKATAEGVADALDDGRAALRG